MPKLTPNVLRNFIGHRATRRYPAEVRTPYAGVRGELVNNIDECIFCGTCARKCPAQCLTVDKNEATWEMEFFACVNCGACADACPTKSLSFKGPHRPVTDQRSTIRLKGVVKKKPKKDHEEHEGGEVQAAPADVKEALAPAAEAPETAPETPTEESPEGGPEGGTGTEES